jgi:hypothetical protein
MMDEQGILAVSASEHTVCMECRLVDSLLFITARMIAERFWTANELLDQAKAAP